MVFTSITTFYQKHKRKIWLTGILAGSAYAVGSYCYSKYDEWKNSKMDEVWIETKKKHHFQCNQQTCTTTYLELLPNLRNAITEKLDIEHSLKLLKNKPPNKMELWGKLKINCFVQLVCSAISSALLLVFLKVQLNILAGYLFVKSLENEKKEETTLSNELKMKYLGNVRFLIDSGVVEMLDDCQDIVQDILKDIPLNDKISHEKLKDLFKAIVVRLKEKRKPRDVENKHSFCSYVIDPNWLVDSIDEDDCIKMTSQMVDIIQGTDCSRVIESIVDSALDETLKQCKGFFKIPDDLEVRLEASVSDVEAISPVLPMAKLIPKLNHHLHEIFKDGRNDFLDDIYANPLLRQFTENIYEAFSQEYT